MSQCIPGVAMLSMLVATGKFFYFIFPTTLKNNNQPVRILFGRTWQSLTWDMATCPECGASRCGNDVVAAG